MKTAFHLLMIAMLTLVAAGCSYSDPDIYYVEPIPGDSARLVVNTNLDSIDNAEVIDSLLFKYRAEIEGGELYAAQGKVEDQPLYIYYANYDPDTLSGPYILSDSFWIMQDLQAGPGISKLQFSIYYSSNTNSLADAVGLEAHVLNLEYTITLEGEAK